MKVADLILMLQTMPQDYTVEYAQNGDALEVLMIHDGMKRIAIGAEEDNKIEDLQPNWRMHAIMIEYIVEIFGSIKTTIWASNYACAVTKAANQWVGKLYSGKVVSNNDIVVYEK